MPPPEGSCQIQPHPSRLLKTLGIAVSFLGGTDPKRDGCGESLELCVLLEGRLSIKGTSSLQSVDVDL